MTITPQCTKWKLPLPPLASAERLLGSCRHKNSLHSTDVSISLSPAIFLFFLSNLVLFSFSSCWPTDWLRPATPPPPPPSGLPLPECLGAAVQFAAPRRGGGAAVALGAFPVGGDFLFASAGLFVAERDVTWRGLKENRQTINRKSATRTLSANLCSTNFCCSVTFPLKGLFKRSVGKAAICSWHLNVHF